MPHCVRPTTPSYTCSPFIMSPCQCMEIRSSGSLLCTITWKQGYIANSHCKFSLQILIANSHCKFSLQVLIAKSTLSIYSLHRNCYVLWWSIDYTYLQIVIFLEKFRAVYKIISKFLTSNISPLATLIVGL